MSDLSPQAEELLKQARESFSPDQARIAALRAAVGAKLHPSLPANGAAEGAAAKVAGIGTATKLVALGVLVVTSAMGARMLAGRAHGEAPVAATPSALPATSNISREPPRVEPAQPPGPPSISVGDLPSARPDPVAAGRTIAAASRLRGRGAIEGASSANALSSARGAPIARPNAPVPLSQEPVPLSQENEVVAEPAAGPVPTVSAPRPVDAALGEEVSILRAARRALDGGDAAAALTLLDRYARAYPSGTMAEESLATRALTLCALGRVVAAKDAARRLEAIAPRSPHLVRVHASCAGDDTGSQ